MEGKGWWEAGEEGAEGEGWWEAWLVVLAGLTELTPWVIQE